MSSNGSGSLSRITENLILPITSAAISIPVVMFTLLGYDINPAFLLAPFIAIAFFMNLGVAGFLYILSAVCGVASIVAVNKISPDGEIMRHMFALILILFAPSFIFLGKMVAKQVDLSKVLSWLSVFSSIFIFAVTARILILKQDVRIYVGPEGLASMNAGFLGIPVFASFGVLSLVDLICLQATIICGSFVSGIHHKPALFALGLCLFCGAFLIIGSDSRSAQILLAWIACTITLYAIKNHEAAARSIIALALIVAASVVGYSRMNENRMLGSIARISITNEGNWSAESSQDKIGGDVSLLERESGKTGQKIIPKSSIIKITDAFTTGRVELAIEGVLEVVASPFLGNGFSSYGRYATVGKKSQAMSMNSSTHIYYLTLIWKGGLLFFLPFVAMLLVNFKNCLASRSNFVSTPESFYACSAVLMAFGPMAMAWDILIVPSAGALAYFLFGMLAARSAADVLPKRGQP